MKRLPLTAIALTAAVAAWAISAGPASATDGVILYPRTGDTVVAPGRTVVAPGQTYVVQPGQTYVVPNQPRPNAVVVWDDDQVKTEEVVIEHPNGATQRVTARYRPDGSLVLPLDGIQNGAVVHVVPRVEYERAYRVFDCETMNSNAEWYACNTSAGD